MLSYSSPSATACCFPQLLPPYLLLLKIILSYFIFLCFSIHSIFLFLHCIDILIFVNSFAIYNKGDDRFLLRHRPDSLSTTVNVTASIVTVPLSTSQSCLFQALMHPGLRTAWHPPERKCLPPLSSSPSVPHAARRVRCPQNWLRPWKIRWRS